MSGTRPFELQTGETTGQPEAAQIFQVTGFVKWFDVGRGYGFIIPDTGAQDILLHLSCHMEVLRRTAIAELLPDQWVYVRFGDGPKGKMAAEVRLSLEGGLPHTN